MIKAKEIFEEHFRRILKESGIEYFDDITFIVIPTAKTEHYTNFDDIFRLWVTPAFKGIQLSYKEVVDNLFKDVRNTMPLWIKLHYQHSLPIVLEVSQRYRKVKEVLDRNKDNKHPPFEIGLGINIEDIIQEERNEAIRILFFTRRSNNRIINILALGVSINEISNFLSQHLNTYRFYPPLYNHQKKDDPNYSELAIDNDSVSGIFKVCYTDNLENIVLSTTDKTTAINYYIDRMIKEKFCGIDVKI